jgi:putative ABC transport system permease protein
VGTLLQDLRYGARMLRRSPGFTFVAVLTLMLGIGATSVIFSMVNSILLRPLPYGSPNRIALLYENSQQLPVMSVSYPDFLDWKARNRSFHQMAAFRWEDFNLTGVEDPSRIAGARVSSGFFETLGINPVLGRTFGADEDRPGVGPVVVIGEGLWKQRYRSDRNIIGQSMTLNKKSYTVIGVVPRIMPPGFLLPEQPELWIPLGLIADRIERRDMHPGLWVVARLKPGGKVESAQAEMTTIANELQNQYPGSNSGIGVTLVSVYEEMVREIRPSLLILMAAVGFVLLIACVNVANLLLARSAARQKEIAIRLALGVSRRRLIQQLLTESVLLSLLGGGLGLILVFCGIDLFMAILPPNSIPRADEINIDWRVAGFTMLVTVVSGMIFGLAPALQLSKPNLNDSLKEGGRSSSSGLRSHRFRSVLVITEIAVAVLLLVGSGLLIKSFLHLQQTDPGFKANNVLTMQLSLPESEYMESGAVTSFYREALRRVKSLPGVEQTSITTDLPMMSMGRQAAYIVKGGPIPAASEFPSVDYRLVDPDYFQAMGIRILQGRSFTDQDNETVASLVIVNEALAKRVSPNWPSESPVGKQIKIGAPADLSDPNSSNSPWLSIVGVAGDVKNYGLGAETTTEIYLPYPQAPKAGIRLARLTFNLVVRASSDPKTLIPATRREIQTLNRDLPVSGIRTMEQILSDSIARERFNMVLLGVFASIALILATVGVYGTMSYSVTQRTHEIGIRLAMGAKPSDVLALMMRQGAVLTLIGLMIGLAIALALTRVMATLLHQVSATDPAIFSFVALLIGLIALLASYLPARRATRVDPMIVLRYE